MFCQKRKIVIIGDSGVGKSSFVLRYFLEVEPGNIEPTIGAAYYTVNINGLRYDIWDTAGQERFKSLCPMYYRLTSGCFCVFDVTNRSSFDNIDHWINIFNENVPISDPLIVLVANKTDIPESQWMVTQKEIKLKSESLGIRHILTSAIKGDNISQLHEFLSDVPIFDEQVYKSETLINMASLNDDNSMEPQRKCYC